MTQTIIYAYTQGTNAYIGKTRLPNHRKAGHKSRFSNWEYAVIDSVDSFDKSEWKPLESYWIEQFRQWGYTLENLNKGGGGRIGFRTDNYIKAWYKQRYLNNKEKYNNKSNQYYLNNKEKYNEYSKKYHLNNLEKIAEYRKQRYLNKK